MTDINSMFEARYTPVSSIADLRGQAYGHNVLFSDGNQVWQIGWHEYDDGITRWEVIDTDDDYYYVLEDDLFRDYPALHTALSSSRLYCIAYAITQEALWRIYQVD